MASFTDQIQQFNPYVQQLPTEVMAQVGMYKQQKYDAGVQKIQSYIDNVAGIKTLRPQDNQYVKSKLNELGSKLKTVAAGDFSNQQLVNSVGGMATSIVKDPIVQAAVYSYSNNSKNDEEMEADRKAGKLTPHAEYVYKLKRNAYLNNPELTDSKGNPIIFTDKYVKSWDLEKNMEDAIKPIGEGKYSVDNLFVTDANGRFVPDIEKVRNPKTGKIEEVYKGPTKYSEYAVREIHAGRLPEAVRAAVNGVLNRPEAKVELGMRGIYEYRGYDDINDFIDQYEKQKTEGIRLLVENKLDFQSKLLNEKDENKKKELEGYINAIDKNIENLKTTTAETEKTALGFKDNLDGYKAMLYTQTMRNQFMKQYNNATVSREFMENVGLKQQQATIQMERDWWKTKEDVNINWYKAKTDRLTYELAKEKQDKELLPEEGFEGGAIPEILYTKKIREANTIESAFEGSKIDLVKQYTALLNPNLTDAQVTAQIDALEKQSPGFVDRQYARAKDDILKNKNNVKYSNIVSLFNVAKQNERKLSAISNELIELDEATAAKVGDQFFNFKELEKGLSKVTITYDEPDKGLIARNRGLFQAPKKVTVTLKPADLINATIIQRGGMFPSKTESTLIEQAKRALEISTGRPFQEVVGAIEQEIPKFTTSTFGNQMAKLKQAVGSKTFKETLAAKEQILQERSLGNSPMNYELLPKGADEKTIGTIKRNFTALLNTYKVAGIDVTNYENYLAPGTGDKNKYSVNIGVSRDGEGPQFTFDLYDGEKLIQSLPATYKGVTSVTDRNLKIPAPVSDVSRRVEWNSKKENPTYSTNSLTSNPFNSNAYKGAYYTNADINIPGAPYFIGADAYKNYSGAYNGYIYVKKGKEVIALPIKATPGGNPVDFPSADGVEATIKSLTSKAAIDNIIKNNQD